MNAVKNLFRRPLWRSFSFSSRLLTTSNLEVSVESGIASVNMQRPPVNSLNLELLTEFCITLDKLHAENCRALVLGSKMPKIFSAGLDIMEMYQPDEARLREFWRALQEVFIKLYGSNMITFAAIGGHAPAGGCLLSLLCDYRVMADGKYTIGLNETLLGIVAPFWFMDALMNTVGHRRTEEALQLGKLYNPQQALTIGMVDSVVPQDLLQSVVQEEMKEWLKIPDHARQLTKLQCRQPYIDKLVNRREEDIDNFVKFCKKESIQRSLGMYIEALRSKSQKK